ncbi:MAG: lactate dehydrogenase-like 2-hydroxyacid dehydrogenase [Saprospiraceae bacterium]|jgi:lactate dehydrogenase-like 2-hydroxyacid dehydrogenase
MLKWFTKSFLLRNTSFILEISPRKDSGQCTCVTATGYNNIDIHTAKKRGISVCNVSGYSTTAVAQHVFAMMSAIQNKIILHHNSVQNGD